MTKQLLLQEVETLARSGELTMAELSGAFNRGAPHTKPVVQEHGRVTNLTNALYVAGGAIIIAALAFLIMQNWSVLDAMTRVLVTLGLGILFSALAIMRLKKQPTPNKDFLGNTLLVIGSFAFVLGVFVSAHEAGVRVDSQFSAIMFTLFAGVFAALYWVVMRSLGWLVFSIASATLAVYSVTSWYQMSLGYINTPDHLYNYVTALIGIGYLLLSYMFRTRAVAVGLRGALFVFGNLFVLGALLFIAVFDSLISDGFSGEYMDIFYPFIVLGMILLAAYWHMNRALFIPVIFLAIYIFHVCFRYFADQLGGSVTLLVAGGLVIGMSYATTVLAKRYLKR